MYFYYFIIFMNFYIFKYFYYLLTLFQRKLNYFYSTIRIFIIQMITMYLVDPIDTSASKS